MTAGWRSTTGHERLSIVGNECSLIVVMKSLQSCNRFKTFHGQAGSLGPPEDGDGLNLYEVTLNS